MADRKLVRFTYTNHRGETSTRQVVPKEIIFGRSAWHPQSGSTWILRAYDVEKGALRDFLMIDVRDWRPYHHDVPEGSEPG